MYPGKLLGRMEDIQWERPILEFTIERHGSTALGSTRAGLQNWIVDVERKTAHTGAGSYRQIIERAPRFDATPVADELADLIIHGKQHELLKWSKNGHVQILTGLIISGFNKQTIEGRRKRLNQAMEERLTPHGWQRDGAWWKKIK